MKLLEKCDLSKNTQLASSRARIQTTYAHSSYPAFFHTGNEDSFYLCNNSQDDVGILIYFSIHIVKNFKTIWSLFPFTFCEGVLQKAFWQYYQYYQEPMLDSSPVSQFICD